MTPEARVTVTMIARDEEDRLPEALESVRWADEVVVVIDAASSDQTEAIARAWGARVLVRAFDGFGPQKNAATALATHPWILSLDADEVVSDELAAEIRRRLVKPDAVAFRVPILLEFLGRPLRFGRDTVVRPTRLFHKEHARFSDDLVHEKVLADGEAALLSRSICHRSYRDLAHYLAKLDRYTTLAAEAKLASGKPQGRFLALRVLWELFDRVVLRLGILDGTAGLTYAVLSTANTLLKYLKLRELEGKRPTREGDARRPVPARVS